MNRLAGCVFLALVTAAPLSAAAQPQWPTTSSSFPGAQSSVPSPPPLSAQSSRRITPRTESGQTASQAGGIQPSRRSSSPWAAFGSLAMIVVVILLAARLWKKHGPPVRTGLPAEVLEILGKRQLDRRHAVQMIRCGTRILVLGVSEEGLRTLAEITDPIEVDYFAGLCRRSEEQQGVGPNFLSLMSRSRSAASTPSVDQVLAERFPQSGPRSAVAPGGTAHA